MRFHPGPSSIYDESGLVLIRFKGFLPHPASSSSPGCSLCCAVMRLSVSPPPRRVSTRYITVSPLSQRALFTLQRQKLRIAALTLQQHCCVTELFASRLWPTLHRCLNLMQIRLSRFMSSLFAAITAVNQLFTLEVNTDIPGPTCDVRSDVWKQKTLCFILN